MANPGANRRSYQRRLRRAEARPQECRSVAPHAVMRSVVPFVDAVFGPSGVALSGTPAIVPLQVRSRTSRHSGRWLGCGRRRPRHRDHFSCQAAEPGHCRVKRARSASTRPARAARLGRVRDGDPLKRFASVARRIRPARARVETRDLGWARTRSWTVLRGWRSKSRVGIWLGRDLAGRWRRGGAGRGDGANQLSAAASTRRERGACGAA